MPRVIGIDPGTVSVDVCGLDDGQRLSRSIAPDVEALAHPSVLVGLLDAAAPLDLVAGPSGYGLPLTAARDLTEADLRLAYLSAEGESGGIAGFRSLMRVLARSSTPVVLTPGVVHLAFGAGAPEGEPRRHGHRGQGVRRRAGRTRAG